MEFPQKRSHHAATHLSGPLFVIVGGMGQSSDTLNDMWLCDTTTKLWKVLFLVTVLSVHKQVIMLSVNSLDGNLAIALCLSIYCARINLLCLGGRSPRGIYGSHRACVCVCVCVYVCNSVLPISRRALKTKR